MNSFDLDQPIIELAGTNSLGHWTIRDSFNATSIMGSLGSGKTTGSGRFLALKFLKKSYSGLVLTAKPDERDLWVEYCKLTGRMNDLVVIEPGGAHRFNFLDYVAKVDSFGEKSPTDNIVQVLKTVIRAGEAQSAGRSDDVFWETSVDMLLFHAIDLVQLAYNKLSVKDIYDIILTIPKADELQKESDEPKAFQKAFEAARQKVNAQIDRWFISLPHETQQRLQTDEALFEEELVNAIPDARLLQFLDQFFIGNYSTLSEKTRSIVDFQVTGFLFRLLREPVYSLFCKGASTVTPEDCLKGKIILVNLPVKRYHKVGRDCQIMFKYIWQRAMEKRDVKQNGRPVFLWADEAQAFIHELDPEFQATARSSRVATVYLTQNLPNYFSSIGGGDKAEYKVKSFMGLMGTKIFHSNSDTETNIYASDLLGDGYFEDRSDSLTVSKDFSRTRSRSMIIDKLMRPEEFAKLKTGGPLNNLRVEAILHKVGTPFLDGKNHVKITFNQNYVPS